MKLELKCGSQTGRDASLCLDGQDISKACCNVSVNVDVHKANMAILSVIPTAIEVISDTEIYVNFNGKKYRLVEELT